MENKPIKEQLEEYYDFCENTRRMSPTTMEVKRLAINYFVRETGITCIEDINNSQINKWMSEQASRGLKGRSINGRLAQVVVMIKWFHGMGVPTPNLKLSLIVKQKEVPPRRIFYDRYQIERALNYADRREWLLISLCFDCGLRMSELRNIRLADISGRRITVIGKGSKRRFVYMSPETREKLTTYIEAEHITDYLWRSSRSANKPLGNIDLRKKMDKVFHTAGYSDFYPHSLRHSFATDLRKNGATIGVIKIALGHSSETTTERYLHDLDGYDVERIWADYKYKNSDQKRPKKVLKC